MELGVIYFYTVSPSRLDPAFLEAEESSNLLF